MVDSIIVSGSGRYADPWHPYAETSAVLGEILADAGFSPRIDADVDGALRGLDEGVRLIVVNAGDPEGPDADDAVDAGAPRRSRETGDSAGFAAGDSALTAALARGIGILAMHSAAASLRDYPSYGRALGGRWVRGRSWHPAFGEATVHVDASHPLGGEGEDFLVEDERYTDLRLDAAVEVLARHEEGGSRHPLMWTREIGRSRVVYDALGHDARSYRSAGHRRLFDRALHWLGAVPVR